MNDIVWAKGMADLIVMLPDSSPVDASVRTRRSQLYREHLDEFSDAAWLHAVSLAVSTEKWFPSVATLREYAQSYTPAYPMLPPGRGEEQREQDREIAKRGMKLCAEAFERATGIKAPLVGMPMPEPLRDDVRSEREALLKQQAEEIVK